MQNALEAFAHSYEEGVHRKDWEEVFESLSLMGIFDRDQLVVMLGFRGLKGLHVQHRGDYM